MLGRLLPGGRGAGEGLLAGTGRPGRHERRIAGICDGALRFEGAGPVMGAPLVIIAFTNRSGSNLLAEYLSQAGRVARAGEFLNAETVAKRGAAAADGGFPGYLERLAQDRAGPGRSLALKASWDQLAMLLRANVPAMFPGTILLHTERADLLRQAVSFRLAQQSGRWTSRHAGAAPEPETIRPETVAQAMAALQTANLRIRLIAEAAGLERHEVSYERMSAAPEDHLPEVLGRAGLAPVGWVPRAPRLEKQAGAGNEALVEAVLSEIRNRL